MWTYNNKQILIVINCDTVKHIQYDDGTQEEGLNAIKSFKRGISVNPNLDKKKYLSLLKVFHPDVSNLDTNLATQVAQAIIDAKNRIAKKADSQRAKQKTRSQEQADSQRAWKEKQAQERSHHSARQKPPRPQKDFETLLKDVPEDFWKQFGDVTTFERDRRFEFRLFKRYYYGYYDTEVEITFSSNVYHCREKITSIHRNCLHIVDRLDLSCLNKNDLWALCDHEAIPYCKLDRKASLVENMLQTWRDRTADSTEQYWSIFLSGSRPVWRDKFAIAPGSNSTKTKAKPQPQAPPKPKDTSEYINCGQYLKFRDEWLEFQDFLDFLQFTRDRAKTLKVEPGKSEGYPSYPLDLLHDAWLDFQVRGF